MATALTSADLQMYIDEQGIDARLIGDIGDTPTVPAAAKVLSVLPEQIIKTLLFFVHPPESTEINPVIVISNGESRVDKRVVAQRYGVGKKRVKLAPPDRVLALLGYPAGGVPPFGHRTQHIPVIIDSSVLELAQRHNGIIFGGGGDDKTMMQLTVAELVRISEPEG